MDKIPHWDYAVSKNIISYKATKKIKYLIIFLLKLSTDLLIGLTIFLIIIFVKSEFLTIKSLIFICVGILVSILPDITLGLNLVLNKTHPNKYSNFHLRYLHYKRKKEGEITFLNFSTQILVMAIAILLFFS